ncbi:MAG TPA: HD domain-containing phosphohydrolase [Oleiagrimonas sp.]|nr:HD domain-containing phosphohydrolase [Oleiagrimonas sp.]
MPDRTFDLSRLEVGDSLPCNVRDGKGTLLLREGLVATSDKQLETLVRHASQPYAYAPATPDDTYFRKSPLALVLGARRHLQALFSDPADVDFAPALLRIAGKVRRACRLNADVALASILMCRDEPYAIRHSVNVAITSCITGTAIGLDEAPLTSTVAAALSMNIGMLALQEHLHALKGKLSDAQRAEVEGHCERGVAILREHAVGDPLWLEVVRDHHEHPDGSGYPTGKTADEISVPAQLVSLGDIYCARVSDRRHRPAMQPNVALRWLFLNEGTAFDERYTALFIKALGVYPPGTGVRLRNGSIGVVTHRGDSGERPKVASITTRDGLRVSVPIRRSARVPSHAITEVVDLDEMGMNVGMEALWGADAVA